MPHPDGTNSQPDGRFSGGQPDVSGLTTAATRLTAATARSSAPAAPEAHPSIWAARSANARKAGDSDSGVSRIAAGVLGRTAVVFQAL